MAPAARSFTEPPGFMNSALPRISQPVSSLAARRRSSGVLPIAPTKPFTALTPALLRRLRQRERRQRALAASKAATSPAMSSAGAATLLLRGARGDVGERAAHDALLRQRCALDERGRVRGGGARGAQPRDDGGELRDGHVEHHRVARIGEEAPIVLGVRALVAADEGHAVREAPMGEGQPRRRRRRRAPR